MSAETKTEPSDLAFSSEMGKDMHIHKPKATHSLREFLSEIGVIVVGIAIALSGEQIVEWLHWRGVVAETREALDRELAQDIGMVQIRIDEAPCMARRLSELDTAFSLHSKGRTLDLQEPISQPDFPHIRSNVWKTAIADQSAAHMPLDVKVRYANLYDRLDWFRDKMSEESEAWSHLTQIDDRAFMTEADWAALHQWKAQAQALKGKLEANTLPFTRNGVTARPFFDPAANLGVKATPYTYPPAAQTAHEMFCRPLL